MTRERTILLTVALGCGLSGGVFFAFSAFVVPALGSLPPARAVAAMQAINDKAVTALFMTLLFGTALACLGVAGWALAHLDASWAPWALAGAAVFLAGAIGVTVAGNVPLNDTLAAVDPAGGHAARAWADFHGGWNACNHIRTLASAAGSALLMAGAVA